MLQPALLLPVVRRHVDRPPVQNAVRGGRARLLPQGLAGERQVRALGIEFFFCFYVCVCTVMVLGKR